MLIQVYVFQAINESCQGLFGMYQHYPQFPTQQNKTLEKIIYVYIEDNPCHQQGDVKYWLMQWTLDNTYKIFFPKTILNVIFDQI